MMIRSRDHSTAIHKTRLLTLAIGVLLGGSFLFSRTLPAQNGEGVVDTTRKISLTNIPNGSTFFLFDLDSAQPGKSVDDPELILPVRNPYVKRIETSANVEISTAIEDLKSLTTAFIANVAQNVTGRDDGLKFFADRGNSFHPQEPLRHSKIYLAQYTPIIGGKPSDITQYRLFTIVDVTDFQEEMTRLWKDELIGQRLTQYLMFAGVVVVILLTSRSNQQMTARKTGRYARILFNSLVLLGSLTALAYALTLLN